MKDRGGVEALRSQVAECRSGAQMLAEVVAGGKRAVANALSRIESDASGAETAALLDAAFVAPRGIALGLTGPPGVGKSTLMDALIRCWRARGMTVGIVAVDPSSARSRGALLGDRTRLSVDPTDAGIFIRSMAARQRLGGLAEISFPAVVLMRALYDIVLVETVGVGQSETDVKDVADLTILCTQPGSGDALQFMKAGIMEIPDLLVVTKMDMGAVAARTLADLKGAVSLTGEVPILGVSASQGTGVEEAVLKISEIAASFAPQSNQRRTEQAVSWVEDQVRARFGHNGLELVHSQLVGKAMRSPFGCVNSTSSRMRCVLTEAFSSLSL